MWSGRGLPYVAGEGEMKICLNNAIKGKKCPLTAAQCKRLHVHYNALPAPAKANLNKALETHDGLSISFEKNKKRKLG